MGKAKFSKYNKLNNTQGNINKMLKSAGIGASILLFASAQDATHTHQYSRTLKFRPDGSFKIVTLSDLSLSDNSEDYL